MSEGAARHPSSFRDPSGFVFREGGVLYRQVNKCFEAEYSALKDSGFLERLESLGMLVSAPEASLSKAASAEAIAILQPSILPFISHPYEWSFGMLKAAALLTLDIQEQALAAGFVLKDASAYNIQFAGCSPVFIDTLSFERRVEGEPWIAYGQFCRHFLAPLALMAKVDVRLISLLSECLDGIPLDLASRLLPASTRLSPGLAMHIHMHGSAKESASRDSGQAAKGPKVSLAALQGIAASLRSAVNGLKWEPKGTEWADYYQDTNYTPGAAAHKAAIVEAWLAEASRSGARSCWDLGANDGRFSRLAAKNGLWTLAADVDHAAVEQAFRGGSQSAGVIHPLRVDLANPSPGRGWNGEERASIFDRGPADAAMALALVHHLAIGNNVPLPMVWQTLTRLGRSLIIEWVPKEDSQIQRMMRARKDVFTGYTEEAFQAAIPSGCKIRERVPISESGRVLYLVAPA